MLLTPKDPLSRIQMILGSRFLMRSSRNLSSNLALRLVSQWKLFDFNIIFTFWDIGQKWVFINWSRMIQIQALDSSQNLNRARCQPQQYLYKIWNYLVSRQLLLSEYKWICRISDDPWSRKSGSQRLDGSCSKFV